MSESETRPRLRPSERPVKLKQCKSCPWLKSTDPTRDIPNGYSVESHEKLSCTIARPGDPRALLSPTIRAMACHESMPGDERPCVGWMVNQLGPGNNLQLRLLVIKSKEKLALILVGEQHERFEDTLAQKGEQ